MGFFYHESLKEVIAADTPPEFKHAVKVLTDQGILWEIFLRYHLVDGHPYEVKFHSGARPSERNGTVGFRPDPLGMALHTSCAR